MSAGELVALVLLGGVVGLDVVSFPQAMISRPIVAATLAGAIAGSAPAGLLVGALLELIALETLPVGASRYPEWGTAAVAAGAVVAESTAPRGAVLALALLGALVLAWAGGWTMYVVRRLNGRLVARHEGALERGDPGTIVALQLRGLTADLARAAAFTTVALLALGAAVGWLAPRWARGDRFTLPALALIAAGVGGGAVWGLVRGAPGARWWLLGGLALGVGGAVAR